jgi:beta-glucanase (GH16 family)
MKVRFAAVLLLATLTACAAQAPFGASPLGTTLAPQARPAHAARLIFDDEFGGTKLDRTVWYTCYSWAKARSGCSNNPGLELEWYQPGNVTVGNGDLALTAKVQSVHKGYPYTSGLISTGGSPTTKPAFSFLYGYIEARMKLPRGAGMWPAFWLVPANGTWPPEIDILEGQGVAPRDDIVTIHWGTGHAPQQSERIYDAGTDLWRAYHTYGVDWEKSYVTWYFDGKPIATYRDAKNIAHLPMYVILNLAIGGWFNGQLHPVPSSFPATMSVDYVRVWNRKP